MRVRTKKPTDDHLTFAVERFIEVDKRIRRGEISPWGRIYKQALKALREAYDKKSGTSA